MKFRILKSIGVVILFVIASLALLLVGLTSVLLWPRPLPPERVCSLSASSIIQLGSHQFRISSDLRGAYILRNGPLIGNIDNRVRHLTKICPSYPNEVFERRYLSIESPSPKDLTDQHLPFAANIALRLNDDPAKDIYETNGAGFESTGDLTKGYSTKEKRYVGTGVMSNATMFLTKDPSFVTPKGNPMVFGCYMGPGPRGRRCFTWIDLGNNLSLDYYFFDSEYPVSEWQTLHEDVLSFLSSIKISSLPPDNSLPSDSE